MKRILCPTRGGEASYANQDYAISLAKERKAELLFLYVADVEFLNLISSPVVVDVVQEIEDMGEFLLLMAQERAEKAGVKAGHIVKSGRFQEALQQAILENEVDTVVVGGSPEETGSTSQAFLENLGETLTSEMGVEVILVLHGEILNSYGKK